MGAYFLKRITPRCPCGARAVAKVYNRFNAHVGDRCARCAKRMIAELDAHDRPSLSPPLTAAHPHA